MNNVFSISHNFQAENGDEGGNGKTPNEQVQKTAKEVLQVLIDKQVSIDISQQNEVFSEEWDNFYELFVKLNQVV